MSLFSGAGGLDIGLEQAGFRTAAAVDFDSDCVSTLRANQGARIAIPGKRGCYLDGAKILHANIEEVTARALTPDDAPADWRPDVLAGGPPCQPFSSAGKQLALDDPRGRLFVEFVRLADELKPRFILFENVRGLVTAPGPSGEPGEALALVREEFERIGYGTTFALMNAADYGLPQRRVRMFMLGARQKPLPAFPPATHAERPTRSLFGMERPWVTLGEFLCQQPPPSPDEIDLPSPRLVELLAGLAPGSGLKSAGTREVTRPGGHWGYKQGTFLADPNKPARTVTAAATQDWIREGDCLRRLTWRECAGLQGFPPEWSFVGAKASRFRQIGNAVPSIFGVVLGDALLAALKKAVEGESVESAPWPADFTGAVEYTKRDRKRNGESRRLAKQACSPREKQKWKGLGSAEANRTVDLLSSET